MDANMIGFGLNELLMMGGGGGILLTGGKLYYQIHRRLALVEVNSKTLKKVKSSGSKHKEKISRLHEDVSLLQQSLATQKEMTDQVKGISNVVNTLEQNVKDQENRNTTINDRFNKHEKESIDRDTRIEKKVDSIESSNHELHKDMVEIKTILRGMSNNNGNSNMGKMPDM